MSKPKFTPGPWSYNFVTHPFVTDGKGTALARLNPSVPEEDARLIAAAPEMYAALDQIQDLVNTHFKNHPNCTGSLKDLLLNIYRAGIPSLVKVRGEE